MMLVIHISKKENSRIRQKPQRHPSISSDTKVAPPTCQTKPGQVECTETVKIRW